MKRKPNLVDHSLFKKPAAPPPKIIKPIKLKETQSNNSLLINIIGFLILLIGGLFMYERLINRNKRELEKQNTILGFHQYVKNNS